MPAISVSLDARELAADRAAVADTNFCSLWPTAKPILQQLASLISSTMVKFAINTVIAAGDAYCGGSKVGKGVGKDDILAQLKAAGIDDLDDLATLVAVKVQSGKTQSGSFICHSDVCVS